MNALLFTLLFITCHFDIYSLSEKHVFVLGCFLGAIIVRVTFLGYGFMIWIF